MNNTRSECTEGFYFKGNNTGVLLIHGFTGTPSEMRLIGEFLRNKGYTVRGILLKGHGAAQLDMKKCSYRDWIHEAVSGYRLLKQECDEVFAVGFSMGGLLSLYLARNYDIKGVAALSTPIKILSRKAAMDFIRRNFNTYVMGMYDKIDINIKGVRHLFKLIRYVKSNLRQIKKPVLIMQSYGDRTVSPISANIIYNNIGSKDKSIVYLHKSGHIITCDKEKERVFEEVYDFIRSKSVFAGEEDRKGERCDSID